MSYSSLPSESYWRRCLDDPDFQLGALYRPRVRIGPEDAVAAAGSCFAQKIGRELRLSSARFLDLEPVPHGMTERTAARLGFGLYSARYGNIYSTAQWLQLAQDAFADHLRPEAFWCKDGLWFDGLRPRLEPGGFVSRELAKAARRAHLLQVRRMFEQASVFIFTLGLTERWQDARTGTVYPICPAAVDPAFGDAAHRFHNSRVTEVVADMEACINLLRRHNSGLRFLFTVSPVPLMATATGGHVLLATSRSKAVLRTAVDEILHDQPMCDYFPSYELATQNPTCRDAFAADQREVKDAVVERIMQAFFAAQTGLARQIAVKGQGEAAETVCDEVLLDATRR
ncbi:MAG: GSCFA domain-containing protein [Rhodobacteraceae bacterium]|nr:GSCFA domain-containing protein [Paracoccaceae bacterium]